MLHVGLYKNKNSGCYHLDIPPELSPTQRRWRPSTRTKNKRVAEQIRTKVEGGRIDFLLGARNAVSRYEFIERYLEYSKVRLSDRTYSMYEEIVKRVLKTVSWLPRPEELQRYWQKRIDDGEIKPITANKERHTLRAALYWGEKNYLISENPVPKVPEWNVKMKASQVWYEQHEIDEILKVLYKPYRPIVELFLETGMRMSECLSISWQDTETPQFPVVGKDNKRRFIPLTDRARRIIEQVRRDRGKVDPEDLVFPYNRGEVGAAFYRARDGSGVKKGHFHALRDTNAVQFLRSGGRLDMLQDILGHEDIETTKEFYAHVPHEDMRAAMERMSVLRNISNNDGAAVNTE